MRILLWIVGGMALSSALAAGCSSPQEVVLRCNYGDVEDVYQINESDKSVRLLSVSPPRPGFLTATESEYRLNFPDKHPADGYLQLKVVINRFTSKAEREIGRDVTLTHQGNRIQLYAQSASGACTRVREKEKL